MAGLQTDGGKVEYVEVWFLFKVKGGEEASEIEIKVLALIEKNEGPGFLTILQTGLPTVS